MFVHSHNVCDTVDPELSDQPLFCNRKINTAKDFRKALIFMHDSVPCANGFWSRKFGLETDEHIRSIPSLVTKETRLPVLQWKILHNIYPTNILLCKMKVRDDRMCPYCNDVVDYIEHFFFDCPAIKKFWNYIEQYILITFDIQTHLTVVDVLFGIKQHNYGKVKTKRIKTASCDLGQTGGHWLVTETGMSINALELKAGLFGLQSLLGAGSLD